MGKMDLLAVELWKAGVMGFRGWVGRDASTFGCIKFEMSIIHLSEIAVLSSG